MRRIDDESRGQSRGGVGTAFVHATLQRLAPTPTNARAPGTDTATCDRPGNPGAVAHTTEWGGSAWRGSPPALRWCPTRCHFAAPEQSPRSHEGREAQPRGT